MTPLQRKRNIQHVPITESKMFKENFSMKSNNFPDIFFICAIKQFQNWYFSFCRKNLNFYLTKKSKKKPQKNLKQKLFSHLHISPATEESAYRDKALFAVAVVVVVVVVCITILSCCCCCVYIMLLAVVV